MTDVREGVDWSGDSPGGESLAELDLFAVRYVWRLPNGLPGGKGVTAAEYNDLQAHAIDTAFVYESTADRALGGTPAGAWDANYAVGILADVGGKAGQPIYAVIDDYGAGPEDYPAILAYLAGWNAVIGVERTGAYGGIGPLRAAKDAGLVTYTWQPTAWSGGLVLDGLDLYQYEIFGQYVNGENVDLDRAFTEDFGQDTAVGGGVAQFPKPDLPAWYARADKRDTPSEADWDGDRWVPERQNVTALKTTYQYAKPDTKSAHTRAPINPGEKIGIRWAFTREAADGRLWGANANGYVVLSGFTPVITLPHPRP
jgi:hypothetical protein